MDENLNKSERQYAAYLARKFFNGKISQYHIIDNFPNFDNDPKMKLLHEKIMRKPKKSWFFGVSKEKYEAYIIETHEIINELEK